MANAKKDDPMLKMMAQMPKILELNPKSPLIEGLLERLLEMPTIEDEDDEAMAEELDLRESASILIDTALIRSGFDVHDSNTWVLANIVSVAQANVNSARYFDRIESLLRRSLGISLSAKGKSEVRPAPPVASGPLPDLDQEPVNEGTSFEVPSGLEGAQFEDWQTIKERMKDQAGEIGDKVVEQSERFSEMVKDGVHEVAEEFGIGGHGEEADDAQRGHDEL
jgi:heat shock protein beta